MRQTCLNMVYDLAKRDKRVVFVGSDLSPGLLADMKHDMPDRWYMEGITEQNLIGMAAGLAKEGYIPYANTIATFMTRRCYEQVAVDLCLHDLPVRLIANGGGLVYAPLGPTHLAIEDIAIMRALPNMTVTAVCDAKEMVRLMNATEAKAARPRFAYFPFGGGARSCIGEPFAWMEGVLLLTTIGQRWRLRLQPGHPVEPKALMTLRPRYGMKMVAEAAT